MRAFRYESNNIHIFTRVKIDFAHSRLVCKEMFPNLGGISVQKSQNASDFSISSALSESRVHANGVAFAGSDVLILGE